ncbi:MAG: hypothetical protein K8W52_44025 [Deltaproteobacteria bacterium]|nr:hypothetical protein [Deltaproteobacteria bacterium]
MDAIPRRFHFLWSGARFPYFARLAIESALVAEPDAQIDVHLFAAPPATAHFAAIAHHPRVRIAILDPARAFDGLGLDGGALRAAFALIPAGALSAQSNLLRYAVLARHGGIYLDTDVLVVRGFDDLRHHDAFAGQEQVLVIDEPWQAGERAPWMIGPALAWAAGRSLARLATRWSQPRLARVAAWLEPRWQGLALNNAVLGARPGAAFVRHLLQRATEVDATIRYRLGPTLITEVARANRRDLAILPPAAFYAVPPSYSFRFFDGGPFAIPAEARVLHVVSSNHAALLGALEPEVVRRRATRGTYYQVAEAIGARVAGGVA